VRAARVTTDPAPPVLVLPALNAMFDIASSRTMALRTHQPGIIFVLLVTLSLGCAFLAGHSTAEPERRNWLHLVGFALCITLSVYVVYDLEYPRAGLIQIEGLDQALIDLRASMK